jgi:hypothetical protein
MGLPKKIKPVRWQRGRFGPVKSGERRVFAPSQNKHAAKADHDAQKDQCYEGEAAREAAQWTIPHEKDGKKESFLFHIIYMALP